ncbi:MAG TPA: tryptophan synthase subunit alpha [Candidatus Sumerlaeota bacterium]|nr:tryptophan synthase subunit alpha [Candidatus Sumerlaeota bacterium]HOR27455.1 tryptophan synthase subunit alpha [Candidatus Sumerlaeota bacterium]HPK02421.1 tryptophan synthase subunit alpha [Candidatus Sumerlaeota bacterium]
MNRIDRMFAARRREGRAAMIFFLTAGCPDLESTEQAIDALAEAGVDLIELGIPFSDPIADGPTIQRASQVALERGTTVKAILDLVRRVRARHPDLALLLFTAYNPVFHYGEAAFVAAAAEAGADGLLIPDLPPEEAGELRRLASERELCVVFLVAPTSSSARARAICEASTGFVYYISLRGVTGARAELPADIEERLRELKTLTGKPVAVGFGISGPDQARALVPLCDGIIVGSALVRLIGEQPRPTLREDVRRFAGEMCAALAEAATAR